MTVEAVNAEDVVVDDFVHINDRIVPITMIFTDLFAPATVYLRVAHPVDGETTYGPYTHTEKVLKITTD